MLVGPNPARRSATVSPFRFFNDKDAFKKVATYGGAVLRFSITRTTATTKVSGYVKIYDIGGQLSVGTQNVDVTSEFGQNLQADFSLYWDGRNQHGLPVRPGVYKVIGFYSAGGRPMVISTIVGIKP
jgi:flagellar hook assembly protein FlgD